jgi:hypothetical protein
MRPIAWGSGYLMRYPMRCPMRYPMRYPMRCPHLGTDGFQPL